MTPEELRKLAEFMRFIMTAPPRAGWRQAPKSGDDAIIARSLATKLQKWFELEA